MVGFFATTHTGFINLHVDEEVPMHVSKVWGIAQIKDESRKSRNRFVVKIVN
jgi:hypothetical protein